MKFIHTGDLHIGRMLHEFSLLEEQRHVLRQIVEIAREEKACAVLLAGDIYDRSVPAAEAVEVLDAFLTELVDADIRVLAVAGNHDSPERLSFAEDILKREGVYLVGTYDGEEKKVTFSDEYGEAAFFLMPYCRISDMKRILGEEIRTSGEGVEKLLQRLNPDPKQRNVLLIHCFATHQGEEPERSDSESQVVVGGLDMVDDSVFASFDYTALGHIHKAQQVGMGPVWYAGTPLKYSFSEVNQEKSVQVVELGKKGEIRVSRRTLRPLRDMQILKGELNALIAEGEESPNHREDYIRAVLTDRDELFDPIGRLRTVYKNVLQVVIAGHDRDKEPEAELPDQEEKSVLELYQDFYEYVTDEPLDEERLPIIREILLEAEEGVRGG